MKKSFMSVTTLVVSISVAIMFLCTSAITAQTTGNKFIYDKNENKETVFELDRSGKYLTPKLQYEFQKDEKGFVTAKKAFRWNAEEDKWTPYYLLTISKDDNNTIIDYALWDKNTESFTLNQQKAVYNKSQNDSVVTYLSYQWDESNSEWKLLEQNLIKNYLAIRVAE
ncbi:MAG: DUF3836 domain-containing protein [Bacteroides sp.]|nr:DUF3836 domain-containing protein [Bacteroides sp.]